MHPKGKATAAFAIISRTHAPVNLNGILGGGYTRKCVASRAGCFRLPWRASETNNEIATR